MPAVPVSAIEKVLPVRFKPVPLVYVAPTESAYALFTMSVLADGAVDIVPVVNAIDVMSVFAPLFAALKFVRAAVAVMAPVPPLAMFTVPLRVMVPLVVIGPPEVVKPVVPPDTATEVTVPVPLPPPPAFTLFNRLKKKRYQSRDTTPLVEMADWFLGSWGRLSELAIGAGQN